MITVFAVNAVQGSGEMKMTKFEEELFNKVPCKFELTTEAEYKKSTLINHFENWHSDEEFQELLEQNAELTRENNIVNQINSKLESQIADLKSQLQQQALPVVPECVADEIKRLKQEYGSLRDLYSGNVVWLNNGTRYLEGTELDLAEWVIDHESTFENAWLDGYTVEKPQLFYLKHIDMSKNDEQVDWYMSKAHRRVGHNACEKRKLPIYDSFKYTQQEIDSMQTGSYEQIEVAE